MDYNKAYNDWDNMTVEERMAWCKNVGEDCSIEIASKYADELSEEYYCFLDHYQGNINGRLTIKVRNNKHQKYQLIKFGNYGNEIEQSGKRERKRSNGRKNR